MRESQAVFGTQKETQGNPIVKKRRHVTITFFFTYQSEKKGEWHVPPPSYVNMTRNKDKNFHFDVRRSLAQDARLLGIKETARQWGCSRNTVRLWLRRYEASGLAGLREQSHAPRSCPHKVPRRLEEQIITLRNRTGYGARRLKMEFDLPCSHGPVDRILKQHALTRKPKTKRQKKNDLRLIKAALKAFQTVHMDVKYLNDIAHYLPQMRRLGLPRFQYTIRDVRTGLLFTAFADQLSKSHACVAVGRFLEHLKAHGVKLSQVTIQTDNGAEFDGQQFSPTERGFRHLVEKVLGARHRFIPPGCSNANADVESSHNLIETEFYDRESFRSRREFLAKAWTYQAHFNLTRKNSYQRWRTPLERVRQAAPTLHPAVVSLPPVDLDTLLPKAPESIQLSNTDLILLNLAGGQHQPGHPGPLFVLCVSAVPAVAVSVAQRSIERYLTVFKNSSAAAWA